LNFLQNWFCEKSAPLRFFCENLLPNEITASQICG
jgi:hypothetical protein